MKVYHNARSIRFSDKKSTKQVKNLALFTSSSPFEPSLALELEVSADDTMSAKIFLNHERFLGPSKNGREV